MKYFLIAIFIALILYSCRDEDVNSPSSISFNNSTTPNYQEISDSLLPYLTGYFEQLDSNVIVDEINAIIFYQNDSVFRYFVEFKMSDSSNMQTILDLDSYTPSIANLGISGYRCLDIGCSASSGQSCVIFRQAYKWGDIFCGCGNSGDLRAFCRRVSFTKSDLVTISNNQVGQTVLNSLNSYPSPTVINGSTSNKKKKITTSLNSSTFDKVIADSVLYEIVGYEQDISDPIDSILVRTLQVHPNGKKLFYLSLKTTSSSTVNYATDLTTAISFASAIDSRLVKCDFDNTTDCDSGTEIDDFKCEEHETEMTGTYKCVCKPDRSAESSDGCGYVSTNFGWNFSSMHNLMTGKNVVEDPLVYIASFKNISVSFNQ